MRKKSNFSVGDSKVEILQALNNAKWRYRTASGIANAIHVDVNRVETVLRENPALVRVSIAKSANGSALFASKKKVSVVSDLWTAFKAVNKVRYGG